MGEMKIKKVLYRGDLSTMPTQDLKTKNEMSVDEKIEALVKEVAGIKEILINHINESCKKLRRGNKK